MEKHKTNEKKIKIGEMCYLLGTCGVYENLLNIYAWLAQLKCSRHKM